MLRHFGASQSDLAAAIEVSQAAVSLWFKGEVSSPKLDASIPAYVAGLERGASAISA